MPFAGCFIPARPNPNVLLDDAQARNVTVPPAMARTVEGRYNPAGRLAWPRAAASLQARCRPGVNAYSTLWESEGTGVVTNPCARRVPIWPGPSRWFKAQAGY